MSNLDQTIEPVRQKRPGGRTAEVTRRINDAVIALLAEGGLDACSFQRVAEKAGVERSTLYRRCPDRWPTIIDAIIEFAERVTPFTDTGSFRGDLGESLRRVIAVLHSPLGPPIMGVAVALQEGVAPDHKGRFWESRRRQLRPMFDAAIARGELPADCDPDEIFAVAAGPFFFFAFVIGRPAEDQLVESILDTVCDRYCLKK